MPADADGVYLRKAEGDVYTWEDAEPLFIPMNDWSHPTRTTVMDQRPPRPCLILILLIQALGSIQFWRRCNLRWVWLVGNR